MIIELLQLIIDLLVMKKVCCNYRGVLCRSAIVHAPIRYRLSQYSIFITYSIRCILQLNKSPSARASLVLKTSVESQWTMERLSMIWLSFSRLVLQEYGPTHSGIYYKVQIGSLCYPIDEYSSKKLFRSCFFSISIAFSNIVWSVYAMKTSTTPIDEDIEVSQGEEAAHPKSSVLICQAIL